MSCANGYRHAFSLIAPLHCTDLPRSAYHSLQSRRLFSKAQTRASIETTSSVSPTVSPSNSRLASLVASQWTTSFASAGSAGRDVRIRSCIGEIKTRHSRQLDGDHCLYTILGRFSRIPRHHHLQIRSLHTEQRAAIDNDDKTSALKDHAAEVECIAAAVRAFHDRGEPFRIDHGSTNSTRQGSLNRDPQRVVNTSRLNRVLHINTTTRTALVEPNVPMDSLVEATLMYNLVPPVVMEFPGITVGGGYNGTSGESSSFRHGFFNRTLRSVEMVLADGEVITCSEEQHPDLFHGAAGALGTFGVTTLVEIQLRPAAQFVETTYHPVSSVREAVTMLRDFTKQDSPCDYVDAILYSTTSGVVVTGKLTDSPKAEALVQKFSAPSDPWFYLHVRERLAAAAAQDSSATTSTQHALTDAIPLPEYLFRYDRGGFWVGEPAFDYFKGLIPFNSTTRSWLDDFLHTRMLYAALHGSAQADRMVIQDLALPYENAEAFVEFTTKETGIWPLWLCPLKTSPGENRCLHPHLPAAASTSSVEAPSSSLDDQINGGESQMLNIGLWGLAPKPHTRENFLKVNLAIEERLRELGGMKWLYAQTFASQEDFWKDFDRDWYEALRKKYRAGTLPSVYDKVKRQQQKEMSKQRSGNDWWPMDGVKGIRRAIRSKQYLIDRGREWRKWYPRDGQT